MRHGEEVGKVGNSSRGTGARARKLHPVATRHLTAVPAVNEDASWTETIPAGCDALISVWWDQRPGADPTMTVTAPTPANPAI
jgi:hypothetical protein